ncbi:Hypothetical predicted protein [Xyrichtys novacula]|uniref:Uncharacterized protein n=1 Tax=Xyrichtys novacula TaxID=13765 RepID=A0AAV1F376_XYRNO|nr:Hypothetical predicted protein [Xyrichtys novacula]
MSWCQHQQGTACTLQTTATALALRPVHSTSMTGWKVQLYVLSAGLNHHSDRYLSLGSPQFSLSADIKADCGVTHKRRIKDQILVAHPLTLLTHRRTLTHLFGQLPETRFNKSEDREKESEVL